MSGGKNNEIDLRSLLTCEVDGSTCESSMCFLGMKQELDEDVWSDKVL